MLALIAVHGVERRAGQLLHPPALAAVPSPVGDGVRTDPADARSLAALEREIAALTRLSAVMFVIIVALSPLVAAVYRDHRLMALMASLAYLPLGRRGFPRRPSPRPR